MGGKKAVEKFIYHTHLPGLEQSHYKRYPRGHEVNKKIRGKDIGEIKRKNRNLQTVLGTHIKAALSVLSGSTSASPCVVCIHGSAPVERGLQNRAY